MDRAFTGDLRASVRGRVLVDEPLSRHTTWRVGGPADLFVVPADREDLQTVLRLLVRREVPWFALGAGSNLLVGDEGFRGAAVHLGALRGLTFRSDGTAVAEGGLPLMTLIRESTRRGLAGMAGLGGIPGTVGGGIAMNAGAGGEDLAGVVTGAVLAGGEGEEFWSAERLAFGYRHSAVPAGRIVVEASFRFRPGNPESLQEEVRNRLLHRRSCHGVGAPNAGSVFKNPPGEAAWRLIDGAGLRGVRIGGAKISEKHCNFIVNTGHASATDILTLIGLVRREVLHRTGIELEPEVRLLGAARHTPVDREFQTISALKVETEVP